MSFIVGGINSIRGFQENSLQAKTYLVLATEYLLNTNFYINTIITDTILYR
jgi:outer membrane protein assembly factor BamA